MGAVDVDNIQEQHMDMNIRVQCTAKALDQVETSRRIS